MTSNTTDLWGHPKGLFILFFTELWERFSYYGMRAILVLFMIASAVEGNIGLGWTKVEALALYGWYTMGVYIASVPGGLIADRLLGQKKTVLIGGFLLCIGHCILALNSLWSFYTGLILIVLGVGGLKPNISTMVGGLYRENDIRRDTGFTIFYIGINLGAFLSSIVVGYVGVNMGWHYGFGLAGIGMLMGQAVYLWGQKYLKEVGNFIPPVNEKGENTNKPLTKIEKDRMWVLGLAFLISIVFWGAFEQAGGLMNIYTDEKIDRMFLGWEIPTPFFQSLNPLFIIIFGTLVAGYWTARKKKNKQSSSIYKMAVGTIVMGTGFLMMTGAASQTMDGGKAGFYWLILAYFLHTVGELCSSPVTLSFITKLAPLKYASLMMGAYFASIGFGNKLAGLLGQYNTDSEMKLFVGIFIFTVVFGGLLIAFIKKLNSLSHGAEDET